MTKVGIGLLAGSALLFSAAVSSAQSAPATVSLSGTTLRHIATDGQTNVVTINNSGSRVVVKDTAGLTAGEGCTQTNATTVSCTRPNTFVLDLKDGNDVVTNSSTVTIFAYGGPGNDVLTGGAADEGLFGDDGDDVVNGNAGSDFLNGGSGNDEVNGGSGDDQIDDPEGDDKLNGGSGDDRIQEDGGIDTISGDSGTDTIFSLDNTKDTINCGSGTDSYAIDAVDVRSSCETSLN
jgi:serralysin